MGFVLVSMKIVVDGKIQAVPCLQDPQRRSQRPSTNQSIKLTLRYCVLWSSSSPETPNQICEAGSVSKSGKAQPLNRVDPNASAKREHPASSIAPSNEPE